MNKCLIFACFVNGLCLCSSKLSYACWLFCVVFYQYKTHYFKKAHGLCFLIFFLLNQNTWIPQNHEIISTKENYAIAALDHQKVLVYSEKPLFKGDQITLTGEIQEIRSESNFNLFHFETMMKNKKITSMVEEGNYEIQPKPSFQRRIYEKIDRFQPVTQTFLKRICYNFENEDKSLIYSSGLHLSTFNQLILHAFSSKSSIIGNSIGILVMIVLGIAFPMPYAIQRILIFNCCRILFSKQSRKNRLGYSMLACMVVNPSCVFELGYILPVALQLVGCFNCHKINSSLISKLVLIFFNFYFFGEVNLMEIFLFSFFRKLHTLLFCVGCLILLFPFLEFLSCCSRLVDIVHQIPALSLMGKPPLVITGLFFVSFIFYLSKGNRKSCFICLVSLCLIPLQSYVNPFYEVTFLNVGQGDCILLRAPFNQANILIDIPSTDIRNVSEKIVVPYLHSLGISSLDTLILTHDDRDHAGGEEELKQLIEVKHIQKTHENVAFGSTMLQSLNQPHHDGNENSLVYSLNIHGLTYLFMGDVTKKVEKELIDRYPTLQADILKVGHHGSKTSTDALFLQQLQCRLAIISAGWHNFYGHPHPETMKTLNRYGVTTHLTFEDGACTIKSFLNFHFLLTSTGDFGIILE